MNTNKQTVQQNWKIGPDKVAGKFSEIRELLYRLYPNARFVKNYYPSASVKSDCGYIGEYGITFRLFSIAEHESNLFLSRVRETCDCGRMDNTTEELWTPQGNKTINLMWTREDATSYQQPKRVIQAEQKYKMNIYRILPELMDEWLKMQFERRVQN